MVNRKENTKKQIFSRFSGFAFHILFGFSIYLLPATICLLMTILPIDGFSSLLL